MKQIGKRRQLIALVAICALALQMVLPFAALATVLPAPGSVICSSGSPAGNSNGHPDCSCAAGCGICTQMSAVLPDTTTAFVRARSYATCRQSLIDFELSAPRFAPQAARPPPLG